MGKGELAMNFIHPTAYVDVMVKLGDNNYIGPFCHLTGELTVGDNNRFEGHCSIGTRPEHTDYWHKNGALKIGNNNVLRDFVTINSGTTTPTEIHNDIIMLRGSHVAHDCIIEDGVTLSVGAIILGHVHVMKESNCGAGCVIHQYQVIGAWSMIGMGAVVPKKTLVEPGKVWVGNPAKILRDNTYLTKNIVHGVMAHQKLRWKDAISHHINNEKK